MEFDEILASSARLALLACLVRDGDRTFTELKAGSGISDGNLHVQTRKLASAGYIEILKTTGGGRPVTRFHVTAQGLEAVKLYIKKLRGIFDPGPTAHRPNSKQDDGFEVWS